MAAIIGFLFTALLFFVTSPSTGYLAYTPDWPSLDTRPIPQWYDEAKFGIFIHWGVYSVPSVGSEWFWWQWLVEGRKEYVDYMSRNFKPGFHYTEFAPMFTADLFDSDRFASMIWKSGVKYVVLTSKHHEGYTLWPSNYSWNWNSVDVGPHADLVGMLERSLRKAGIRFGLYFSLTDWFHPFFLDDKSSGFKTQKFAQEVCQPQLQEIVTAYSPDIVWSDGDGGADSQYWNSTGFLAWLYNDSPVKDAVVVNDRWGSDVLCQHGGVFTCVDRYSPGVLQKHKWENCMTVDRYSWGFRRTATLADILSVEELLGELAKTVSCGGNLLMNVGPTHDGRIIPIFEERLTQMGEWLKVNGEAVYGSKPWIFQNDTSTPDIWYTSVLKNQRDKSWTRLFNPQECENTIVYAFVLKWPGGNLLKLGAPKASDQTTVSMLGSGTQLKYQPLSPRGMTVDLTQALVFSMQSQWAWVLKIEHLASESKIPVFDDRPPPTMSNTFY